MALSERIKIIFERVDTRKGSNLWGPSEWRFTATVNGTAVGNPAGRFAMEGKRPLALPEAEWSTIVDTKGLDVIDIEFAGTAVRDFEVESLGNVKWKMRFPYSQRDQLLANKFFALSVRVELEVGGAFGKHPNSDVFAARVISGRNIWTTVSGGRFVPRLEFCDVRPVPSDPGMPPRPKQPAGVGPPKRNSAGRPMVRPTDSINFIHNPSVIPVLAAADASDTTAACIEYTYYRPASLAFTDADPRLQWTVTSIAGGAAVAFVGKPEGAKIYVYGTVEGEVSLECRMEGVLLATYRALVRKMHDVTCRFNILNGPPGSVPRATPDNVLDHIKIANIWLRQAGLQLVLDTDPSVTDRATVTTIPGIFRIQVRSGMTAGVALDEFPKAPTLNYRAGIMNFAYIHSMAPLPGGGAVLGEATDIPLNTFVPTITDSGTPSTSWKKPSGVLPDKASKTISMKLFPRKRRPGHPDLYGMYVTGDNGSPSNANDQMTYAGTIAHELGHVLGLRHRIGAGDDLVKHPLNQNLMHGTNPSTLAQDIDIIQSRAVMGSPAVK